MKKNNQSAANPCQKYGIAITDYVLGEPMDISYEELLNHLKECAACRKDFADWRSTYAALKTEAYHKTPEAKKRYAELLEKIKNLPASPAGGPAAPKDKPIDDELVLGSAAEKVYNALKGNGKIAYPVLREKAGLKGEPFYEASGWLAKEKKIRRTRDEQTVYVALTESEHPQAQV